MGNNRKVVRSVRGLVECLHSQCADCLGQKSRERFASLSFGMAMQQMVVDSQWAGCYKSESISIIPSKCNVICGYIKTQFLSIQSHSNLKIFTDEEEGKSGFPYSHVSHKCHSKHRLVISAGLYDLFCKNQTWYLWITCVHNRFLSCMLTQPLWTFILLVVLLIANVL